VYPTDAIHAAEAAMQEQCDRLVYKDGCRRLRHGRIELAVTLDANGEPTTVETVSNTVTEDAPLVLSCVTKALARHTFASPGTATTITVQFRLVDKC
jgi:hypothetical protein